MKSMKTIVGLLSLFFAVNGFAQGSLTPPGAPAPVMKTLDQIESRTAIMEIPYVISEPGSYYLTTNLNSTGGGIDIQANHVSLDFNGFTITGSRNTSFHGVTAGMTWTNIQAIAIKGGMITEFGNGIFIRNTDTLLVQNMIIVRNAINGIQVYPYQGNARGNKISECLIGNNGGIGIYFSPVSGECSGNIIEDCTIRGNQGYGICMYGNSGSCFDNILQRNNIGDNVDCGVNVSEDADLIQDNHVWRQRGVSSCGIYAWGGGSFVARNMCAGNTNNYTFGPDVTFGPVVTNTGVLPTTGAAAHPQANFSR
ncbi:MAG: right-handed parallel beta-helix repeat-containing protein [Kiritimatiellales bacterium]|jgi:hypothetical protein